MNKNEDAILYLELFDFLTVKKKQKIISFFNQPYEIFDQLQNNIEQLRQVITKEQIDKMLEMLNY